MTATAEPETAPSPAVPWEQFFRGVEPYVQQLAGKLARQFPELPLEDVKQELLLALLSAHHLYDPTRGRPTTWVHLRFRFVAERLCQARRRKKRPTLVQIDEEASGYAFDATDPRVCDPGETAETADDVRRVREALRRLSPRWRRVLALRYGLGRAGEERTLAEVGEELGVTRERARQLEKKALARLAEVMGADPDEVTATAKTARRRKGRRLKVASGSA